MKRYILSAILGAVAGIMGGALGTSGAFTILPGLLILGIVKSQKMAAGTTLVTILAPLSILAAVEYYKKGNVDLPVGIIITISYMLAAWAGAKFANTLDDSTIQKIVGVYLLLVAGYFFYKSGVTKTDMHKLV